jgi:hypothetical protein
MKFGLRVASPRKKRKTFPHSDAMIPFGSIPRDGSVPRRALFSPKKARRDWGVGSQIPTPYFSRRGR